MIDENKSVKASSQLTSSQESRVGAQRASKKAKTVTVRVPCGELTQAHTCDLLNVLCQVSPGFTAFIRTCHPHASIGCLPPEIIYRILDFLSLPDIGRVAQASSSLNAIVLSWVDSNRVQNRIACLINQSSAVTIQNEWSGRLDLPPNVFVHSRNTGILLKRLSCLFPTSQRLCIFFKFACKLKEIINRKNPAVLPHTITSMNGVILQTLIAGWDLKECVTVFNTLNSLFNIPTDVSSLFQHEFTGEIDEKLYLLRIHIRALFVDFVASTDRNLWTSVIFNGFNIKTAKNAASMLLLLFAPFGYNCAESLFSFFLSEINFHMCISNFKNLAETLVRVANGNILKNVSFTELFVAITRKPYEWPFRAQACLLLSVHFYDNKLVMSYFRRLAAEGCDETVIALITEVMSIANPFLSLTSWRDCPKPANNRSVLHLILNALNAGWSHEERRSIVRELWKDLKEVANDLLEESLAVGFTDDLREFLETWRSIAFNVSY